MANHTDPEEKRKELENKTALLKAEREYLEVKQALEAVKAQTAQAQVIAEKVAAATAAQKLSEAEKASAEARKAQAEAILAALKAQIGEIPKSPYTGEVDVGQNAGTAEALLLSAKAVDHAASKVAEKVPNAGKVVLYPMTEAPRFNALLAFNAQSTLAELAFTEAEKALPAAQEALRADDADAAQALLPVAGAGLALDAFDKVLGFFRTDYAVGGITLTQDESLLVHAVAGHIRSKDGGGPEVLLPGTYNPKALAAGAAKVLERLRQLADRKAKAQQNVANQERKAVELTAKAEQGEDANNKKTLEDKAQAHKKASDALRGAIALYDGFFGKLTAVEEKGSVPLNEVIRDAAIEAELATSLVLFVRLHSTGGSYYTKKNMWTLFGGMPFYHMAGVVVSYVLMSGSEGKVQSAAAIPVHGGFFKAGEIEDEVTRDSLNLPPAPNPLWPTNWLQYLRRSKRSGRDPLRVPSDRTSRETPAAAVGLGSNPPPT